MQNSYDPEGYKSTENAYEPDDYESTENPYEWLYHQKQFIQGNLCYFPMFYQEYLIQYGPLGFQQNPCDSEVSDECSSGSEITFYSYPNDYSSPQNTNGLPYYQEPSIQDNHSDFLTNAEDDNASDNDSEVSDEYKTDPDSGVEYLEDANGERTYYYNPDDYLSFSGFKQENCLSEDNLVVQQPLIVPPPIQTVFNLIEAAIADPNFAMFDPKKEKKDLSKLEKFSKLRGFLRFMDINKFPFTESRKPEYSEFFQTATWKAISKIPIKHVTEYGFSVKHLEKFIELFRA
jgi:hypothetical protein